VPRAVSLLKTASYAEGCNFTKEVELVGGSNLAGNGNFADESNFESAATLPGKYAVPPTKKIRFKQTPVLQKE
jgi:hypothetical protein